MKQLSMTRLLLLVGVVLMLSAPPIAQALDTGATEIMASTLAITPVSTQPEYPSYPMQPQLPTGGCGQYQPAPAYPTQPMPSVSNCGQYPQQYVPQPTWVSPKAIYQSGLQLVRAKRYQEAIQVFAQFLQAYPNSDLADNALYWTGESYYDMRMYPTAIAYFQQIQYRYPRGNKVPDSMLKGALAYFAMNQSQQGCMLLNELQQRYPSSESARKARRYAGRCQGGGYYPQNPCQTPYQTYQQAYQQPYQPPYGSSGCQTPYQSSYGYAN